MTSILYSPELRAALLALPSLDAFLDRESRREGFYIRVPKPVVPQCPNGAQLRVPQYHRLPMSRCRTWESPDRVARSPLLDLADHKSGCPTFGASLVLRLR